MSRFGRPPVVCEFGSCHWSSSGGYLDYYGSWVGNNPTPFTPYTGTNSIIGNGGNTTQGSNNTTVNTLLNNTLKNPTTINTAGIREQPDIFTQIKALIVENPLITFTGVALLVYLIAKKK